MAIQKRQRMMLKTVVYLLFGIVFVSLLAFAIAMIYLDVNYVLITEILAGSLVFIISMFSILIFPTLQEIYSKIYRMEQNVQDSSTGTKLLIRRDLELSRANEKLQELDEIKSNFISVVAHQLRTPLSGIKWTLNMILNGDMGELNNDQKTFLMKSNESNNRMITLVNDMLNTDRIQSGKVHYSFAFVNMVDLLDNVLFELSPLAAKKKVTIEYKNKFENLPQAYVDPATMRAVVQNLLENAVKYTMNNGKIVLDVQNKQDKLEISISDNGIGIPEAEKPNIFGKFYRAANALKQETDGSGLGLYIVKTIVEKNGGQVWFESKEGAGTTFYFTVPLHEERKANAIK